MKKSVSRSFATRLANAKTLHTILQSLKDYSVDDAELTVEGFAQLLGRLEGVEASHTEGHRAFDDAIVLRHDLFANSADTLSKKATRIRFYMKSRFRNQMAVLEGANRHIDKIKGQDLVRYQAEAGEKTISRAEKSFGAQLVNFTDLITFLGTLNGSYRPANATITVEALSALRDQMADANRQATLAHGMWKQRINDRRQVFAELADVTLRIKDAIRSQYGTNSDVYAQIRDFDFRADDR